MDFYDAMKNGTSEKDLVKAFNEALDAAKKKLEDERREKEETEKRQKNIDVYRAAAATAFANYIKACRPDINATSAAIENNFKSIEKFAKNIEDFTNNFSIKTVTKNGKSDTKIGFGHKNKDDDTILNAFFDQLLNNNWLL